MSQASLFDVEPAGRVRRTDPTTSIDAARTCNAASQRERILALLADAPHGATTEDLERQTGWVKNTIASRLCQMRADQQVYVSGERTNSGGKRQQVWWPEPMVSVQPAEKYL